MSQFSDAHVEEMAKAMIRNGGGNPDILVHRGEPNMYGTPEGVAHAAFPGEPVPMWTLYQGSARKALEIASSVLLASAG
jgi:hypothetical protein